MPAKTDPNLGIFYGWSPRESGWNTGMDANLKKLGALVFLSVKSRTTTAQPTSPAEGDRYIVPASATGTDWAGHDGSVALYQDAAWTFYAPSAGWEARVEDDANRVQYTTLGGWAPITSGAALPSTFIDSLQLEWVSGSAITLNTGSAYIPSSSALLTLTAPIAKSGLTTLTASTWYYVYLFDNAGTPDIEIVTTAPAAPYAASARTKSGDTTRRLVGAIKTDASGNIQNFRHDIATGRMQWVDANITTGGDYRVMAGVSVVNTATPLDLSLVAPPAITTECLLGAILALDPSAGTGLLFVDLNFTLQSTAGASYQNRNAELGASFEKGQYPTLTLWIAVLASTPSIYYYSSLSSSTYGKIYIDVFGYGFSR